VTHLPDPLQPRQDHQAPGYYRCIYWQSSHSIDTGYAHRLASFQ
jgi:hypothetical protein